MTSKRNPLGRRIMAGLKLRPPVIDVPPRGFSLDDVTVINPGLNRKKHQKLIIRNTDIDDISAIGPENPAEKGNSPYAGAYVLPGLIDMHVHYPLFPVKSSPAFFDISEWAGPLYLLYGVTTVRDVGNFNEIWSLRQRMESGEFPAPRIFCCGPILDGDPPRFPDGGMSQIVRNAEEGRDAVEKLSKMGVDHVKVYDNLTLEALIGIRETAKEKGLLVVGHLPFAIPFEEAGIEDLQHFWGIQFNSLHPGLDFNKPDDFGAYMNAWATIDDAKMDDIVRISVEQGITHTPTVVVQDRISRLSDPEQIRDPIQMLLPRFYRDVMWNTDYGVKYLRNQPQKHLDDLGQAVVNIKRLINRLHQAGVQILTGSDGPANPFCVPGISIHEELNHFVDAGLTPEEAWVTGTRAAGECLKIPMLGTLQKGAPADILVFRKDPTHDISALSTLEAVSVDGRLYTKEVLDQAMVRHQKYFDSWLYDRVMMKIIRSVIKKLV